MLPVTEDFDDEQNSNEDLDRNVVKGHGIGGALEPVDEEDPKRMSKDGAAQVKRRSALEDANEGNTVPPL